MRAGRHSRETNPWIDCPRTSCSDSAAWRTCWVLSYDGLGAHNSWQKLYDTIHYTRDRLTTILPVTSCHRLVFSVRVVLYCPVGWSVHFTRPTALSIQLQFMLNLERIHQIIVPSLHCLSTTVTSGHRGNNPDLILSIGIQREAPPNTNKLLG